MSPEHRGGYIQHRVFFADEATAIAAGYRPCAACCPERPSAQKCGPQWSAVYAMTG